MAKQNAPFTINLGRGIKAKVWTNSGNKGTWYNVTFARCYRDDDGECQSTSRRGQIQCCRCV